MQRITLSIAVAALFALTACSKGGGEAKKAPATEKAAKPMEKKAATKPAEAEKPAEPAKAEAKPAGGDVSEAAMAEAKQIFSTRCASCHGPGGKGDGPAAAALNPKPRTLTDAEWQGKVTDEHLAKVIVEGGQSVGLSPLMAANPDLKDKTEVVQGIVKIVRGLKE